MYSGRIRSISYTQMKKIRLFFPKPFPYSRSFNGLTVDYRLFSLVYGYGKLV